MDPSEVEFLGEKKFVEIIPSFSFNQIHLISGSVGPFRAGLPTLVPIWLAVNLKQQQKCRIVRQEWMSVDVLNEVKTAEQNSEFFTKMPSDHYMDEALVLLGVASDDIEDSDQIRTIIKDIWDIRMSKLRTSGDSLVKSDSTYGKLDHLTPMEVNSFRPLFPHVLDQILRLQMCGSTQIATQSSQDTQ
ncbi:probable DNA replication complex GINS protein PSF2 [Athalia rosae]|uniref:probable DNA replication complex GINS protein PSF2 n=1 Tax=Athalia rosae TaxID=37344 RepID=UPI0020349323|nr:probable DNA replication complex GINS protein PSF2 [Athalia rosae]